MNDIEKNISIFLDQQFPEYFRTEGPLLVKFIKYYYEWMEQEGNLTAQARSLTTFRDSLNSPDYFFTFLRNEFMRDIPENTLVNDRLVLRRIIDFYRSKGDEKSFRLLFRILYGEEINFYYPSEDILRTDDGKWVVEKYIEVTLESSDAIDNHTVVLRGSLSGATARIDRVETVDEINDTTRIYLTSIFGDFINDEDLISTTSGEIIATTKSTVQTLNGRWLNTDGFLDSNKRLQDDFYYQAFSYEIQSTVSISEYRDIVKKLVHPSGMKLFGRLVYTIETPLYTGIEVFYDDNTSSSFDIRILLESQFQGIDVEYLISTTSGFDLSTSVTDGVLENTARIRGTLSIGDDLIETYSDIPIGEMDIPIELLGSRNIIVGSSSTRFLAQNIAKDSHLTITDTGNSANDAYIVSNVYSNTFLRITPQYAYSTLSNGTGKFWAINAVNLSSVDASQTLSAATQSATGEVLISGSSAVTLAAATQSAQMVGDVPTAPLMVMTSDEGSSFPEFSFEVDDDIGENDIIKVEVQVSGGDWSSLVTDIEHTITADEDTSNTIVLSLGSSYSDGQYDIRSYVIKNDVQSNASEVVTFNVGPYDIFTGTLNTDGIGPSSTFRMVIPIQQPVGPKISVVLKASATNNLTVVKCAIGKLTGSGNADTTTTPVELTFSGGSGFTNLAAGGSRQSDYVDYTSAFTLEGENSVCVIIDVGTPGGVLRGDGNSGVQGYFASGTSAGLSTLGSATTLPADRLYLVSEILTEND